MFRPVRLLGVVFLGMALIGLTLSRVGADEEKKSDPPKKIENKKDDTKKDDTKKDKEEPKKNPQDDLIGKPAPNFDVDFALNGPPSSQTDLKGKVVLLDFWAVWCGPCIATFPHLKEWNSEFKDKGLEIVGVTRYYKTTGFDKEAGKTKRLDKEEAMSKEQENEMLKDFIEHHKLGHLIQPLSNEEYQKLSTAYMVKGIPTAVLIDRKGMVRMIKVGSGKANAEALESEIKKLLDEK